MPKDYDLYGFDELGKAFKVLPGKVQKKFLRNAATLSTTPIVQHAKRTVPVSTRTYLGKTYTGKRIAPGFGKRSIAKKTKLYQNGTFAKAMVGVKPEAHYLMTFVHRGTSRIPANPWLETAYKRARTEVEKRFRQTMRKRILEFAKGKK